MKCFFPKIKGRQKKVFTAIWDYNRPELVGFIRAGWFFFVSSSSAQILVGGRLNLNGGGEFSCRRQHKSRKFVVYTPVFKSVLPNAYQVTASKVE